VKLSETPLAGEIAAFVPAQIDGLQSGISAKFSARTHHTMFVEETITVAIRSRIDEAIRSAVGSANDFFGHHAATRRDPCLKEEKFPLLATPVITHLGYVFDTRALQMAWPLDKQESLHNLLSTRLRERRSQLVVNMARVLGLISHGAMLCPMGEMLSIQLQWVMNAPVKAAGATRSNTSR
jgi:hypothetical protein